MRYWVGETVGEDGGGDGQHQSTQRPVEEQAHPTRPALQEEVGNPSLKVDTRRIIMLKYLTCFWWGCKSYAAALETAWQFVETQRQSRHRTQRLHS